MKTNTLRQMPYRPSLSTHHYTLLLLPLCFFLLTGCGGKYPASVSGIVTLDGKPLSTGNVVFHPIGNGSPVVGRIDPSGEYTLKTGTSASLLSGDYEVTVQSLRGVPRDRMTEEEMNALSYIPRRYNNKQRSGLRFAIGSGKNQIDIVLESATPPQR